MKQALILATTNPKKVERLSWIFSPYFEDIQPQDITVSDHEDGQHLEDDAATRAVAASVRYNCPAVATETDPGKEVLAIANNGKLLFSEEVESKDEAATWARLKEMVDWFLLAK